MTKPITITPETPYLFIEIWTPKRPPYNAEETGWPCIVGDFCKPILDHFSKALVWFVREGPWFQLCVAYPDAAKAEKIVRDVAKRRGFRIKRILPGVAGGGLAGGSASVELPAARSLASTAACLEVSPFFLSAATARRHVARASLWRPKDW